MPSKRRALSRKPRLSSRGAGLSEYARKRRFSRTTEPEGGKTKPHRLPHFVVQKHDASRLHYDLRLEVDGVLKSWAVPKGPSSNPDVLRLAVAVEDHPLEYEKFEGIIPEPEYGAGTVMVWDYGVYQNLRDRPGRPFSMERALREGKVEVGLQGKKLIGAYAIIRTGFGGKANGWMLKKMKDDFVSTKEPVETQPDSAKTGRTMEEIAGSRTKWESGRQKRERGHRSTTTNALGA